MGRQHIHFATGIPESHKNGKKPDTTPNIKASASVEHADGDDKDIAEVVGNDGTTKFVSSAKSGPESVISGMRKSATIMIWVDMVRSITGGGLKWWRSDNGVILTEGDKEGWVEMEWVDRVERRGTGEILWQRADKAS